MGFDMDRDQKYVMRLKNRKKHGEGGWKGRIWDVLLAKSGWLFDR